MEDSLSYLDNLLGEGDLCLSLVCNFSKYLLSLNVTLYSL